MQISRPRLMSVVCCQGTGVMAAAAGQVNRGCCCLPFPSLPEFTFPPSAYCFQMAEEDFSILKKSVIPNLLQEGFQPTFLTEIEEANSEEQDIGLSKWQWGKDENLTETEDETTNNCINHHDRDVGGSRGSYERMPEEVLCDVEEKRRSFRSNIDYKKTLGCILILSIYCCCFVETRYFQLMKTHLTLTSLRKTRLKKQLLHHRE